MKFQKRLLFLCSIIFLVSIASVCAGDVNETLASNTNNSLALEQIDDNVIESSQENLLGDDDKGTFTDLQKKIVLAPKGSTITLDKDYSYDEGFSKLGVFIDKDLTINGNGHTLNGLSKSRILLIGLSVIGDNNKVTLNNIKFANGNTSLNGGAIFNYGNLTVNNCKFTNNHAKQSGGAIASIGFLNCKNSKFSKNVADGDGGAIFTLSIEKSSSIFNNLNITCQDGDTGFLFNLTFAGINFLKERVTNCVFSNNVAKGRGGGAIYAFGNIYIKSSNFSSNKAGEKGGAVFGNRDLFISNSRFTSNQAPMYGGAVYFKCHAQSGYYENNKWISQTVYFSNSIKDSTFSKNSASRGGAIYGFRTSSSDKVHCAKAVRCTFTANKAPTGRDIYGGTTSKCVFNYLKLTLNTVNVKKSAKKLVLTAKLTKGKTLIKSKKITFKFNGKTYTAKTNSKGIAKVTVKSNVLKKLTVGKKVKYQAKYSSLSVTKTAKVKK